MAMKEHIHFFSEKEIVKKGVDREKLGMRGRQANDFAELFLPILPGIIVDSDAASALGGEKVAEALSPHLAKIKGIVGKGLGDGADGVGRRLRPEGDLGRAYAPGRERAPQRDRLVRALQLDYWNDPDLAYPPQHLVHSKPLHDAAVYPEF